MSGKPLAVYVSPGLSPWLDDFPAEVLALNPEPGIYDLPAALAERGVTPDLILQDETLVPRTLLKGLESFDCPKIFWSLDPHLNHYWQAPYCALFDAVAVTQKDWIEPLRRAGVARVEWITWCAENAPWVPFAARPHLAAFVGRTTAFRPLRRFFVDYLTSRFPLRVETDIPHDHVQAVYTTARLAPNESIQGEITERLFTAAGAGCLVFEPRSDNALEELFEPGREVLTYADALELNAIMERFVERPAEAERLGRAAWERVAREHRPRHRVQALAHLALGSQASAPRGAAGERLFWLGAAHCLEANRLAVPLEQVIQGLEEYQEDPDCLTAILRLLVMGGQAREALAVAMRYAAAGFAPASASFMICACALALRLEEFSLAQRLYEAFATASGDPLRQVAGPAGLYAALAESLARREELQRPGFPFEQDVHLPATASEMYRMSLSLDPDNQSVLRKAEALLRDLPGSEVQRLGLLSELSLRKGEDYRLGLALGLADLKAFRVIQGLEEVRLARLQARARGKGQAFERLLAARDSRGHIRAVL
jgi:hypothetical protein